MSSYEDNQPLNRSLHSSVAAPSISVPVEPSGQLGVNGLQPSFALELDISSIEHGWYGNMINGLGSIIGAFGTIPCCIVCPSPYESIQQGNVGLISRFGKFYKCVDPGLVKINVATESIRRIDVKMQIADIPSQYIMTKDNVTVKIDSVLYWCIIDPYQATYGVSDIKKALVERTQTTLRHILGGKVLQECVENRDMILQEVQTITSRVANEWGVKIESILIKDFNFSKELQESLSAAAQARRIGESKIITAKAEVDSAKLMREAADMLSAPSAMQIRYLETLSSLSKAPRTKIVFLPSDSSSSNQPSIQTNNGVRLLNPAQSQNFISN